MSHYDLSKFTPKSWINAIADEGSKQEMIWWLYEIDQERAQQATRVKELEKLLAQRAEEAPTGRRLVYNKTTKRIEVVRPDGLVVDSFEPPIECNDGPEGKQDG